ncbi:unnamed protein product, partial [marine sediment metagenome]
IYQCGCAPKNVNYEPLLAVDLPVFPDKRKVIKGFIGIDIDHFSDFTGIIFVLPNYGARIKQVSIGSYEIKTVIEPKITNAKDVIGKVYGEKGKKVRQSDVNFVSEESSIKLDFKPDYLYFSLLSKKSG